MNRRLIRGTENKSAVFTNNAANVKGELCNKYPFLVAALEKIVLNGTVLPNLLDVPK